MRTVLLLFALFTAVSISAQGFSIGTYKVTPAKMVGWGLVALGGAFDGATEVFDFDDRLYYEYTFGVSPYSFWGSKSSFKVYVDRDPAKGFKSPFLRWTGAFDVYHVGDDARKGFYTGGSLVLGISGAKENTKFRHYLFDFAISWGVSAITKSILINTMRI